MTSRLVNRMLRMERIKRLLPQQRRGRKNKKRFAVALELREMWMREFQSLKRERERLNNQKVRAKTKVLRVAATNIKAAKRTNEPDTIE